MTTTRTVTIGKEGRNKTGYCSVCASDLEPEINKRMKAGWNAAKVNEWLSKFERKPGVPMAFNRQTLYKHRDHITSSRDKVVAYAERARQNPVIKATTNRQFLEAVRDVGMTKAVQNPEDITIGDALKAVQIMENSKQGPGDTYFVLAQIMTAAPPALMGEVVEGEAWPTD